MEIRASSFDSQRLLQAAADGDISILTEATPEQISRARCNSGCTCLHWAAGSNQLQALTYLIQEKRLDVNIEATKKAKGRTPLHYCCRNGHMDCAKRLVELGAEIDARAKHSVSPFQLAVWQCHLDVAKWLVREGVDPAQVNEFECGAVHWIGLCPLATPSERIIEFARWLAIQPGVSFRHKQRQGHSPLHKSAWGGHLDLIQYLKEEHGMMDDTKDLAGNYAADLADMANTDRHREIATYLRRECSLDRARSCSILGVDLLASQEEIRKAFLQKAKVLHPDRATTKEPNGEFSDLQRAYDHLIKEDGMGKQMNPAHSLKLMLEATSTDSGEGNCGEDCFKARLIAVLLEYGDKGLEVGNIKKKWKQVWPDTPFPEEPPKIKGGQQKRKGAVLEYIMKHAADSVAILASNGTTRLVPRNVTQAHVLSATDTYT
jgi:hypothetical protein